MNLVEELVGFLSLIRHVEGEVEDVLLEDNERPPRGIAFDESGDEVIHKPKILLGDAVEVL